ncbi:serine hydrolase domain-containing protein [Nonomuraea maheshkhaliensis]|uniref:Serine hydrolase domain-containing protein n=1 Tax=Nonomuraea maheshkhaliensis TaxID=419590 RepID=A0ABN2HH35_9ACTN
MTGHDGDHAGGMDADSVRKVGRRRLLGWSGLAAGAVAAGGPLAGAVLGSTPATAAEASVGEASAIGASAAGTSWRDRLPPDTLPGGAYDRFVAELAAQDKFSGVVLLSYRGRTVLSRAHGMADEEKGIRNHENVAFNLSSAGMPFLPVAVLQLVQRGQVKLSDLVGAHVNGLAADLAAQVSIHHLLTGTSGIDAPAPDVHRVFTSREEVREYHRQWARQATLRAAPGSNDAANGHTAGGGAAFAITAQIVEAVTGTTYWDYMHEHVFARAGMRGSGYYTRTQWLADERIAHPYMRQPDGGRVDGVRNLDKDSMSRQGPGENPGRAFVGNVFATAPDLARFAHALSGGTVLERPYADLYTGAKRPHPGDRLGSPSFASYAGPIRISGGQWEFNRGGGSGGISASWTVYLGSGWTGVVLSNYDELPDFPEILQRQDEAITGRSSDPGEGGGGVR